MRWKLTVTLFNHGLICRCYCHTWDSHLPGIFLRTLLVLEGEAIQSPLWIPDKDRITTELALKGEKRSGRLEISFRSWIWGYDVNQQALQGPKAVQITLQNCLPHLCTKITLNTISGKNKTIKYRTIKQEDFKITHIPIHFPV